MTWGDFDGTDQFMFDSVGIGCPPDGWIYDWNTAFYDPYNDNFSIPITLKLPSMTSTVTVSDTIALQGAVNASVSALSSSISAVAGSLNVSGIGCSTIVLSGTYSDSTSFAYNFVIQPTA